MQQYHFTHDGGPGRALEKSVLFLGLIGFTTDQEQVLQEVMSRTGAGGVRWRLASVDDADAWWVNGSRAQLLADGSLRVAAGVVGRRSVQLQLAEVDRPIAFSEPLAPRDFEPACRFSLESVASMHQMLAEFEKWLRPLAAQLCVASGVISHEAELVSSVYHVSANGRLLAVIDLRGDAGVLPTARSADFEGALWSARPSSAAYIPDSFARVTMSQLMWQYALRTELDLLPGRYRTGAIYFRRPPHLAQRVLSDTHLLLMRELASEPATFEDLQFRTGLAGGALARHLAALYLVGSITSNARRARRGGVGSGAGLTHSGLPSRPDEPAPPQAWLRPHRTDPTAPAPLHR